MRTTISQRQLRNDSGVIMRRVEIGESFTVAQNGSPVADLVPHVGAAAQQPQGFVPVDTIAAGVAHLPNWGIAEFVEQLRELDDAVNDVDIDRWTAGG